MGVGCVVVEVYIAFSLGMVDRGPLHACCYETLCMRSMSSFTVSSSKCPEQTKSPVSVVRARNLRGGSLHHYAGSLGTQEDHFILYSVL